MYVGRKMTTDLITVTPDTPLVKARDLLREKNIKQLPVVDEQGNLVGILTDRDIKQACPAETDRGKRHGQRAHHHTSRRHHRTRC
jgi:acetoin utilization protein AcuB